MKYCLVPTKVLGCFALLPLVATAFAPLSRISTVGPVPATTQTLPLQSAPLLRWTGRNLHHKAAPSLLLKTLATTDLPSTASFTALSTTPTSSTALAATSGSLFGQHQQQQQQQQPMSKLAKTLTKFGMIAFITTVAFGLITSLSVIKGLGMLGVATPTRRQRWALRLGQFWARWALRLFPFCKVDVIVDPEDHYWDDPAPHVWVANHISMLDVFLLLASDKRMRGPNKRPIKIVYWKQLEDNPFTKILFQQSGFIPIDMVANKPGEANEYDKTSFKTFLKDSKQAFADGFDIGVLPEGQLNPHPERGLMPIFSGAYTLARMSRRPIQMLALHGVNNLWHPHDGMDVGDFNPTGRHVKIRVYPSYNRPFESNDEFKAAFSAVVGHFGKYGTDAPDATEWLDGTKWQELEKKRKEKEEEEEQQKLKLLAEKEAAAEEEKEESK